MNPGFQEGRRPRANAVASLTSTGHTSPLARRPSIGAVAHSQRPGAATRPGPRPMSAQQIASVNAAQSHTKRTVNQVVQLTKDEVWRMNSDAQLKRRMEMLPYSKYDANKINKTAKVDVVDEYGTPMGQERYVVGQLWVFASTLNDAYGTRRYWVYNTQTNVLISFEPELGIAAKNRTYMSEKDRFINVAASTGVVGGYLEKGFLGLTAGMLTGGLIYEAGGIVVVGTAIRAYAVQAAKGAAVRGMVDFFSQFTVGTVAGKGSLQNRALVSLGDVNWLSVGGAAAVNTEGLKWCAKLLTAFGSSVVTNAYSIKHSNVEKYGSAGHLVNSKDQAESKEFVINIILGTVFDQTKEYGAPWLEKVMRNTPSTAGMLTALRHNVVVPKSPLRTVDQIQVAVLSFQIGGTLETVKKMWENYQAELTAPAKKKLPASATKGTTTK